MKDQTTVFSKKGNWYKGNLHTHTLLSDGKASAEQMVDEYRRAGYHFLSITDHNIFQAYSQFSDGQFLMLPGTELTPGFDMEDGELMGAMAAHQRGEFVWSEAAPSLRKKIAALCDAHVLAISRQETGVSWKAEPQQFDSIQNMINYAFQRDCISIVAHPAWSKLDSQALISLKGYAAIEVYNHVSHPWAESSLLWDSMLNKGLHVFALASDDAHELQDACGGYMMLKAESLTHGKVIEAIEHGDYYSSCGPIINGFHRDGETIVVQCSACKEVRFLTDNMFGKTYRSAEGDGLTRCEHKLFGDEAYVRVEVVDSQGLKAWTNPIFLEE